MVSIWCGFICLMISLSLSEANHCKGSAVYTLTFKAEWTRVSHLDFPSNPHFSRLVGCSHNSSYVMWRTGENATLGVQRVAELGNNDVINNEMEAQIQLKNAFAKYLGSGITGGGVGTATRTGITVNQEYPLVSFITMIAPSPDWFIGVRDYNLCNETSGKWLDERVHEMFPYDSGTDSGPRFASDNNATQPHVPIFLIANTEEGSFKSNDTINRFGTFTFTKTSESNVEPTATTMSPKPTSANDESMSPKPTTTLAANNETMSPKPTTIQVVTATASTMTISGKASTTAGCTSAQLNMHVSVSILIIISSFLMYTAN